MLKYISLLFIIATITLLSQTVTVRDKTTKTPIEQAFISGEKMDGVRTNSEGKAEISRLKNQKYIFVRSVGYQSEKISYAELESNNFEILMTLSQIGKNEVVISAVKWRQLAGDMPVKITSISPSEIAMQAPQTTADLLGITGKVFIQKSQQGGGSPMIRGFATNRLLYSVDGVRMNNAIFRGGNIQNVISLDPFNMESVEVLFGPGSTIYGSDAIGGVMSFQTKTPQFSTNENRLITGSATGRVSSANNEFTGNFNVNIGWEKWAAITSVTSNRYGDLEMGRFGPDDYLRNIYVKRDNGEDRIYQNENPRIQVPTGFNQNNIMQKVRFMPNENWDINYGFHYSETSEYSRFDRLNRFRNGMPRDAEWNYGPQIWMMNNLSINNVNTNMFYNEFVLRLAHQSFEESRISRALNSLNRQTRIENVEAYSINLDFEKYLTSKNTLFYGVEYILNDVISKGIDEDIETGETQTGAARYPNSDWSSYSVYFANQHKFSDALILNTTMRYNIFQINSVFDTRFYNLPFETAQVNNAALTGSAGLVWRPADTWVLSSNVSRAFRSPNVDDIGKIFDSEPGAVTVPNPALQAEYAYNVDFGIAKTFGEFLKLDLTAYYTILENAMVRRDFTLNGQDSIIYDGELTQVQAIQNAATANVYGIQAGMELRITSDFSLLIDYNYQIGEEEMDDGVISPSRHAAPQFGIARLKYDANKLNLELNTAFSGEFTHEDLAIEERNKTEIYALDDNGNTYSPSWYTLNFRAMYPVTQNLSVIAGLENITNQRYRTYSSGIAAPGRNFVFSIRANF